MFPRSFLAIVLFSWVATAASAAGQQQPISNLGAERQERLGENHFKLTGRVEITQGDTKLYADEVEYFQDQDRAIATGNVVLSQGSNSIAADKADFNMKTRLGTFYNATGIANIKPPRQRPAPGAVIAPPMTNQPNDVYFFGDVVEKIGAKKYKITNGGFSTCVQPTPRWDLHAGTVIVNIDHYTVLKQAIFNVKGVPMLYVPVLYYPTKEEDRATGFLLPTYGTSTTRGQSIHNAFFWAIDRSQDATFMHDWYSKTGQAFGSEYRYNLGTGDGAVRANVVDDHETTYPGGVLPASRSYEIVGSAAQALPFNLRARGYVNYFSSVTTNQTFNTNIYDISRSNRTVGANVIGGSRLYSFNATYGRTEYFSSTTTSVLTGTSPRIALAKTERPLFPGSLLYFSLGGEYVHFDRESKDPTNGSVDTGLSRFDVSPQIRYPFKKWQWFTVNSTASVRDTFYNRSADPDSIDPRTNQQVVVDTSINRRYATAQAQAIGPVFSRIWRTPDLGYAEGFKHTIEPVFTTGWTSMIDNFDQIVKTDSVDQVVGTTSYSYGVNNRLYAKRRIGQTSQAQEILTVSLSQAYYTNKLASQYDRSYQTSYNSGQQTNFSPVRLDVRAAPTIALNGTFHAEFDSRTRGLRLTTVNGIYNWTGRVQTAVGWTRMYFIKDLPGFNDPNALTDFVTVSSNAQTRDNRFGGRYSFSYDVLRTTMTQQSMTAFYNSQCCGVAFQYVRSSLGAFTFVPVNHQFFFSFTLAGLGNFSPLNGALNGVPR